MNARSTSFGLSLLIHLTLFLIFLFVFKPLVDMKEEVLEIDLSFFEAYERIEEKRKIPDERDFSAHKTYQERIYKNANTEELKTQSLRQSASLEQTKEEKTENSKTLTTADERLQTEPKPSTSLSGEHLVQKSTPLPTITSQPTSNDKEGKTNLSQSTTDASHKTIAHKGNEQTLSERELYIKEKLAVISSIVQKNITYPHIARKMGWEGKVLLGIMLKEDGSLEDVKIVESSGYEILDKNALETIKRTCYLFPKPPVKVYVVLPVAYKLY